MDVLDVVLGSLSFNPFCLMNQFLISNSRGSTGASSNGIHYLFLISLFFGSGSVFLHFFFAVLFYSVIRWLFPSMKCPNCAKAIRTKAIRCPRCGSSLTEEEPQEAMNAELYARVKALVVEQTRASAEKINPDTLLADDLGIAGDDGYELLEAFCEEFEIQNMSEIEPYEYFGPEGCNPFDIFVFYYYLVFDREKLKEFCPALTLRDLVKSAEAKKWIPPEAR